MIWMSTASVSPIFGDNRIIILFSDVISTGQNV